MKDLQEYIKESSGFEPAFSSHKKAYNNLLKWYDKCLSSMNRDEIIDLLKTAIANFETDDFSAFK